MEEEPNDGGQTNPQQDMKDTKDAVKDGANLAKMRHQVTILEQ